MSLSSSKYPTLALPSLLGRERRQQAAAEAYATQTRSPLPEGVSAERLISADGALGKEFPPSSPSGAGGTGRGENAAGVDAALLDRRRRKRIPIVETDYGPESRRDAEFGGKTLGYWSSVVLLVNNITGPGMLALPLAFVKGGFLVSLLFLGFFGVVGSLASLFICAAISRVPAYTPEGEETPRMEYCPLVSYWLKGRFHYLVQFLYNFSLQTKTISSIIISAQVMDKFSAWSMGSVRGCMLYPHLRFVVADPDELIPFATLGDSAVVVSTGYLISAGMFLPLGLLNLDENIAFQWISGVIMVAILGQFGVHFASTPSHPSQVPWVSGNSIMMALGVVMFCFTFIDTVPSWYNERRRDVPPTKTLLVSVTASAAIYVFIGIFGALAFPHITSGNVLELMADEGTSTRLTQISAFVFSLSTIGLGIPIFCIIMRYNLYVGKVTGSAGSKFWGAIFPWLVSFFLYQGTGFIRFVNWTSLIFTNFTNFILPSYVYLLSLDGEVEAAASAAAAAEAAVMEDPLGAGKKSDGGGDLLNLDSGEVNGTGLGGGGDGDVARGLVHPHPMRPTTISGLGGSSFSSSSASFASMGGADTLATELTLTTSSPPAARGLSVDALITASLLESGRAGAAAAGAGAGNGIGRGVVGTSSGPSSPVAPGTPGGAAGGSGLHMTSSGKLLSSSAAAIATLMGIAVANGGKVGISELTSPSTPALRQEVMIPGPQWLHARYPRLLPWAIIVTMTLVSALSLGIDLYFLIRYGIDLTDIE